MSGNNNKLFNDFPPVSTQEWEKKIHEDLKGADYEKKLVWKSLEGIKIKPYHRNEDLTGLEYLEDFPGNYLYTRSAKNKLNEWEIRQTILVNEPGTANKKALDILKKGVNSLRFVAKNNLDQKGLSLLLDNLPSNIPVHLVTGNQTKEILGYLKNIKKEDFTGSLDFDPIGELISTGNFYNGEKDFETLKEILQEVQNKLPGCKVTSIKGNYLKNAGASIVQELAFTLSMGSDYLVQMKEQGIPVEETAKRLIFNFASGSNYFMEIAKLRAARLLWRTILDAFGLGQDQPPMFIHTVTEDWNKTIFDPHVNILRASTESMAAIVSGTDSLEVTPHNSIYQESSSFTERVARNIQIVLKEEAHLNKVIDPGAGSYYIEKLTDSLLEETWKLFISIEEKGGFIKNFKEGIIQQQVGETANTRLQNIATKKDILLGTNQYPNQKEYIAEIDKNIVFPSATLKENRVAEPIPRLRGAQEFEKMRLKVEKLRCKPKVYLVTYGNPVMKKARADFSANFFACGGFDVVFIPFHKDMEEGIDIALKEQADIIVLCSSDDEYKDTAPKALELVKDKAVLVIAGYPASILEELQSKGLSHFIHLRSNMLKELEKFQELLNIK